MTEFRMSSNRPYLLRAVYEWISDNGLTPYLLVDAKQGGVRVPQHAIKDGQVVLNVAMRAVAELQLGLDAVTFSARFNGVSQQVNVPMHAVLAVYAQENGQGMMFPPEPTMPPASGEPEASEGLAPHSGSDPHKPQRKGPQLRVVK